MLYIHGLESCRGGKAAAIARRHDLDLVDMEVSHQETEKGRKVGRDEGQFKGRKKRRKHHKRRQTS